jgi:condensin complex subunit 1
MANLDPEPYRFKLAELIDAVKYKMPSSIKEAQNDALQAADQSDDRVLMEIEAATLAAALTEADAMVGMNDLGEAESEFLSLVKVLRFTQNALEFIAQLEGVTDAIDSMLFSVKDSDVTEALRFLVKARHFKLPFAAPGIKRALALMWSSEQSIKDEVLKTFIEVFLASSGSDGEENLPSKQIAENLLLLTCQASVSELACIEEVLVRLVKDERIPADVFKILWSVASRQKGETRATAMQLIAIGAKADRSIVDGKSRLKSLLDTGLGDYTEEHHDWDTARSAALALQCVERAQVDPSCAKYLVLERIMERLCSLARGDWCLDACKEDTLRWFSAAEQAIVALFVISPNPEAICSDILHGMHAAVLGDSGSYSSSCNALRLSRFFHVLGHIALNLLVYTEALSSSVRRATSKKSLRKQEEAQKSKSSTSDEEANIEAELGMAAEVEAENERQAAEISEKEIVGRGLISIYEPLLARAVLNEGGHCKSKVLLQSATLALCKLMCVSSSFCEKHLPLLFKVLTNEKFIDTTTQANIIVALGDLAFRFPNEVEPYTAHLYSGLRDPSRKVRRHTLMVLTHLILNDMVKVKGQVSEIALCLQDEDVKIKDLSRLLFHQLSKRSNNVIYNLLPDIISRLSELSLPRESFRGIMSFLFGFIDKDKQNDVLVDKMCQRFPLCSSIAQKCDLAFCIAQIKMTDRTVKVLDDKFKLYQDALVDDEVKKHFFSIVTKAKKFAKPELKQSIEEWEKKLNEFAEIGMENQKAGEKAARAMAQVSKRAAKKKGRPKQQNEEAEEEELTNEQEDELEFPDAMDKENTPGRRKAPKTPKKTPRRQQRSKRR